MIQGLVVARAVRTQTTATATEFVRGGSTRTRGTVHVTGTCTVYCVLKMREDLALLAFGLRHTFSTCFKVYT